jgi:hypothetical protein
MSWKKNSEGDVKMKDIMYIAIPYSHPDPRVRELRFEIANFVSAKLMNNGKIVFSPISHSHPMVKYGLPTDWKYWKSQDTAFLNMCSEFGIVKIDGWEQSKGVSDERDFMFNREIEIEMIEPFIRWGYEFERFVELTLKRICDKYINYGEYSNRLKWEEVI